MGVLTALPALKCSVVASSCDVSRERCFSSVWPAIFASAFASACTGVTPTSARSVSAASWNMGMTLHEEVTRLQRERTTLFMTSRRQRESDTSSARANASVYDVTAWRGFSTVVPIGRQPTRRASQFPPQTVKKHGIRLLSRSQENLPTSRNLRKTRIPCR